MWLKKVTQRIMWICPIERVEIIMPLSLKVLGGE